MEQNTDSAPAAPQVPNQPAPKQNTGMAILCYLSVLVIIPLLTDAKNDPFVKFHIKQGLALLIFEVIGSFVWIVPVLGWLVGFIVWILTVVFFIMGIVNAVSGKEKELPLIGRMAENFNF